MRRTCKIVDGQAVWEPPFTPEEEAAAQARCQEMFVSGRGPALLTDSVFLAGTENGRQFEKEPSVGDLYRQQATDAGVDTTGKVYQPGLAAYPGDPEAWVSGRGDVQKICETKGYNCDGAITVKALRREEPPKDIPVAPDLLEAHTDRKIEENPELALKPREEVKEQVLDTVRPSWSRK